MNTAVTAGAMFVEPGEFAGRTAMRGELAHAAGLVGWSY